jgi:hypothetical protein
MNRTIAGFALLGIACLVAHEQAAAQAAPDPWYGRQARPQNFDSPKVFTGTFSVVLPKNWQLAAGHTGTIFSIVEPTKKWQTGALITLEYMRLQAPLEPALMTIAAERQLKFLQSRESGGKQFSVAVKTGPFGPIIFIQYDRPGITGSDDHVAQYEIPVGTTLYQLICIAPKASIEKYRPVFAHVAATFTPLQPSGP